MLFSTLVFAEAAYRLFHNKTLLGPKDTFSFNPDFGYTYNPLLKGYAGGFRGGIPLLKKIKNEKRILCIGESITSGDFITKNSDTWPIILESYLAQKNSKINWKVYNAAIGGYGTGHMYTMLKFKMKVFDPDMVIICGSANGNGISHNGLWAPFPVWSKTDSWGVQIDKFCYRKTFLYRLVIRHRLIQLLKKYFGITTAFGDLKRENNFEGVDTDVRKIIQLTQDFGAIPVVILFPYWKEKCIEIRGSQKLNEFERSNNLVVQEAHLQNVAVFDMRNLIDSLNNPYQKYFLDCVHLRYEACDIFSKNLADSLINKKINPEMESHPIDLR